MAEEEKEAKDGEAGAAKGGGIKALLVPVLASVVSSAIVAVVMTMVMGGGGGGGGDGGEEEGDHGAEAGAHGAPAAGGHGAPAAGGHGAPAAGGHGEAAPAGRNGIFHQYDPFVVTIFDHEKVHYLKTTVALEVSSTDVQAEIVAKDPQIKDSLLLILGDFTLRELLDNQSKMLLKDKIVQTLNKVVGKDKILNVYFLEYTIQ